MANRNETIRAERDKLKRDVLRGTIGKRTHCIHCAMVGKQSWMTPTEIGGRAKTIAQLSRVGFNSKTYLGTTTSPHLDKMLKRGFAERDRWGRWRLTDAARAKLASGTGR